MVENFNVAHLNFGIRLQKKTHFDISTVKKNFQEQWRTIGLCEFAEIFYYTLKTWHKVEEKKVEHEKERIGKYFTTQIRWTVKNKN